MPRTFYDKLMRLHKRASDAARRLGAASAKDRGRMHEAWQRAEATFVKYADAVAELAEH